MLINTGTWVPSFCKHTFTKGWTAPCLQLGHHQCIVIV